MAEEIKVDVADEAPRSKEEMRYVEHEYEDFNGWCAVCGRSENWKAHQVKEAQAETNPQLPSVPEGQAKAIGESKATEPLSSSELQPAPVSKRQRAKTEEVNPTPTVVDDKNV